MKTRRLAMLGSGLVTSVGFTTASCCSAFRAKTANPRETRFIDSAGAWILAHEVLLSPPTSGLSKLATMAAMAVEEALADLPREEWQQLPLLLCVADSDRPGRIAGLDDQLFVALQKQLGSSFAAESAVVPHGRVAVAIALAKARELMTSKQQPGVLIVSVDSLLSWPTLSHFEREDRLLTEANSDGFMPGEGAGALWVGAEIGSRRVPQMVCTGIGFGREPAPIGSGEPLRAEGLTRAIRACLGDAGQELHELDFRVTDNAGEGYYFKESSLALTRTLRQRKEQFDLWHPAECTGEVGAVSGVAVIAAAHEACKKGYAPGNRVLTHWGNDAGRRAAASFEFVTPSRGNAGPPRVSVTPAEGGLGAARA